MPRLARGRCSFSTTWRERAQSKARLRYRALNIGERLTGCNDQAGIATLSGVVRRIRRDAEVQAICRFSGAFRAGRNILRRPGATVDLRRAGHVARRLSCSNRRDRRNAFCRHRPARNWDLFRVTNSVSPRDACRPSVRYSVDFHSIIAPGERTNQLRCATAGLRASSVRGGS